MWKKRNTTPLLAMKTLTSIGASGEMAIGRAATGTRVKPDDERGNILSDTGASGWDWRGGTNNSGGGVWDGDGYRCVVVLGLRESYGRGVPLSLLRGWLSLNRAGIGGGGDGGGG